MREQDIMVSPDSYFSLKDDWTVLRDFLQDHSDYFTEEIEQKIKNMDYFFGIKE